jgi:NAD(P)-dependent dehydrogenase (short-subunit alcohol dehydrogenase family)
LFDLTGKTAVVIGAASGIGEAVALGCAAQGARIVCLDVNAEAAARVAARGTAAGGQCEAGPIEIPRRVGVEKAQTTRAPWRA